MAWELNISSSVINLHINVFSKKIYIYSRSNTVEQSINIKFYYRKKRYHRKSNIAITIQKCIAALQLKVRKDKSQHIL